MQEPRFSEDQFEDRQLTCYHCGATFSWAAREQAFYARKGLNEPKRCKACRRKKHVAGTYGSQVAIVDSATGEVLCKRCSRPASRSISLAHNETICVACFRGQDPKAWITPDDDKLFYDQWEQHYNRSRTEGTRER